MVRNRKIGILGVALGLILNAGLNLMAQALSVSTSLNNSAISLVNNVLGEGIEASTASRTGTVYSFSDGTETFGIDSGIILDTSGRITGGNDADLAKLMDYDYGGHTSTLEFELISTGTLLNFNYVFASREFDQPVKYNDVFGLFVSVNDGAYENIALIERNDGKEVPVTINNLRAGVTGTEAPSSFSNYPVSGRQYSLFKATSVALNETTDGISNVFTAFKEVSVGDKVKVKFAIADVSDNKYDSYVMIEASSLAFEAPGGRPNYYTERLYNLEPNTTYKIRLGGVDYTVTTDENGETPIVTDKYDLFGHTIQIAKVGLGQTAQTLKVAARPDPPEAIEGPDANYVLPDSVQVTETSITIEAEDGQQYRIDDEESWRDQDGTGHVTFENLTPNVEHTIYTRYAAADTHPASFDSEGTTFATRRSLDYSVKNYYGLYDGLSHSAEAASEHAQVLYSATRYGNYGAAKVEYTEPGNYPVYFLMQKEGYYSVYGELSVRIVGWDLELQTRDVTDAISLQDRVKMGEGLEDGETAEFYFEAEVERRLDTGETERLYETAEPLTVSFPVSREIAGWENGVPDGEHTVLSLHDGEVKRIRVRVQNGVLSFEAKEFGEYGFVVNRPEPPEPVESVDENGALLDTVKVTDTSIEILGKVGQEYRVDGGSWVDIGAFGEVVFNGLQPNGVHIIETRYKATSEHPASLPSRGTEFRTVNELRVTVQNYRGLYDGLPHAAEVENEGFDGVYYSNERNRGYTSEAIEFTEPGVYTAYYLVQKDGYYSVYGETKVEIIEWTMEDVTDGDSNFGGAIIASGDLKEIVPLTDGERTEMLEVPETVIYLKVDDVTNTVSLDEMLLVRDQIKSSEEILAYFDVNLFKKVGQMEPEQIHETNAPVRITLMPEMMVDEFTELLQNGEYSVVRIHNGLAERLDTVVEDGKVSFETDRFSLYALVRPVISQETDEEMPGSIVMGVMAEVAAATASPGTIATTVAAAGVGLLIAPETGVIMRNFVGAAIDNLSMVIVTVMIVGVMMIRFERRAQRRMRQKAIEAKLKTL